MKQVPNILTVFRLLLVPLIWKLLWDREYERALAVGAVAAISDALDGFVARRLKATSKFGAFLDPIADKLMLSGAYLIFALDKVVPPWLPWIVLGRDALIIVSAAIAYRFAGLRDFPPSRWGKLATLLQILTALVILVNRMEYGALFYEVEQWMMRLCAAVTLWSGIHYCWLGIRRLRRIET